MAGHSKWATTKHKKAANDAKRSKEWAKAIKSIEVAARTGGGDPAANPTLDDMIRKAKKASVPNDNIERARKRGAGEIEGGAAYESVRYEGYGPNGVAMIIDCLTDNRNRAAAEVRTAMSKNGGNLGESGSVGYMFNRIGYVVVNAGALDDEERQLELMDAGATEWETSGDFVEITCDPSDVRAIEDVFEAADIEVEDSGQDFRADITVPLELEDAQKIQKLIDALEESDDVQDIYTNMDISEEVAEALAEA